MTLVLGLVGKMAAGKTTATDYLKKKHGAVSFRFSDVLRDVLDLLSLPHNRENMQILSTVLRTNFSEDILSIALMNKVKKSNSPLIICEGIRRPSDITYLKELDNFVIISIIADERARYERIIQRKENPDDQNKTFEKFQAEGQAEAEQNITEIAAVADYTINNNGNLGELQQQINNIISKHQ